jgi:3-dehydroquinate dehydratase-2
MKFLVLNGPNLGRLGTREPEIYGSATYTDLVQECESYAASIGVEVDARQSDDESVIISWLHEAADQNLPVILNPAAFTHYSIAIRDAAAGVKFLIEVHLTNPHTREEFRHISYISGVSTGVIAGFGFNSYRLAISAMKELLVR